MHLATSLHLCKDLHLNKDIQMRDENAGNGLKVSLDNISTGHVVD